MTESRYPTPDRSNFVPNADDDVKDIGWAVGVFSDGRPWRCEAWAQDQVTMLTIFFSSLDLEDERGDGFATLLEREGMVTFGEGQRFVSAVELEDACGAPMWSVNVVVGDDDATYATDHIRLLPYTPRGAQEE